MRGFGRSVVAAAAEGGRGGPMPSQNNEFHKIIGWILGAGALGGENPVLAGWPAGLTLFLSVCDLGPFSPKLANSIDRHLALVAIDDQRTLEIASRWAADAPLFNQGPPVLPFDGRPLAHPTDRSTDRSKARPAQSSLVLCVPRSQMGRSLLPRRPNRTERPQPQPSRLPSTREARPRRKRRRRRRRPLAWLT